MEMDNGETCLELGDGTMVFYKFRVLFVVLLVCTQYYQEHHGSRSTGFLQYGVVAHDTAVNEMSTAAYVGHFQETSAVRIQLRVTNVIILTYMLCDTIFSRYYSLSRKYLSHGHVQVVCCITSLHAVDYLYFVTAMMVPWERGSNLQVPVVSVSTFDFLCSI